MCYVSRMSHTAPFQYCVSALAAAAVAAFTAFWLAGVGAAADFQWLYAGAQQWRVGVDPYSSLGDWLPASWAITETPLFYPFPAVLVALPFSLLSSVVAGVLWSALSAGLLAYGLLSTGEPWRLLALVSVPALVTFGNVQWSALLLASVYLPVIGWVVVCKPSAGLAAFVHSPRWSAVVAGASVVVLSLVLFPRWPLGWLANLSRSEHTAPAAYGMPGLMLLSLVAWRRPAGRMFAAWSLVPGMVFFYDALLLYAVPRSWRQMYLLVACSWVAAVLVPVSAGVNPRAAAMQYEYWLIYVPALAMLLFNWWRHEA